MVLGYTPVRPEFAGSLTGTCNHVYNSQFSRRLKGTAVAFKPVRISEKSRDFDHQLAELQVRAVIRNRFTRIGTPTMVFMS